VNPHRLAADLHSRLAEVDLQLSPRRRLEAHRRPSLRPQILATPRHRPLYRAQADDQTKLRSQVLAHHVGVPPVPKQPLGQPFLPPIQDLGALGLAVGRPPAALDVAPHRVAADPQLGGNPLGAPAQRPQAQHRRHIVRRPHLVSPRNLSPQGICP
jgi:hypothetical protein